MKAGYLIIFGLLSSCINSNRAQESIKTTSIKVLAEKYDFKNISTEDSVVHTYQIVNTGNYPLVIKSAKSSCGCTIPYYSDKPVNINDTAEITVKYKPGKSDKGIVNKSIVFHANTDSVFHVLYISGIIN